jgi:hypothetical protein
MGPPTYVRSVINRNVLRPISLIEVFRESLAGIIPHNRPRQLASTGSITTYLLPLNVELLN